MGDPSPYGLTGLSRPVMIRKCLGSSRQPSGPAEFLRKWKVLVGVGSVHLELLLAIMLGQTHSMTRGQTLCQQAS